MNPDTESRLRAALHRRADSVTSDRLTQSFDTVGQAGGGAESHPPTGRSRSWILPAAVAVVVAAAATGIGVASHRQTGQPTSTVTVTTTPTPSESASAGVIPVPETTAPSAPSSPSPTPTATATPSATSKPSPTKLGPITPVEQPKSAVPWGSVGPGWTVASWFSSVTAATSGDGNGTLFLVSPTGTRYAMAQVPRTQYLVDVTPDGRRAILAAGDDAVVEINLATGASHRITVGTHTDIAYTKPDGHALLVTNRLVGVTHLERRGLDGALQLTFPDSTGEGIQAPDGTAVLAPTNAGIAVYGNASGTILRTLPYPSADMRYCGVKGWWPDGRAEVNCGKGQDTQYVADLYLYPVDGSPATQLTDATTTTTPLGFGYVRGWPVSNGIVAQEASGCGVGPLVRVTGPTTSAPLQLQLPPQLNADPENLQLDTVVGDVGYYILGSSGCGLPDAEALLAYDLVTGRSGVLLGPGANGGTVGSSAYIDPSRMRFYG